MQRPFIFSPFFKINSFSNDTINEVFNKKVIFANQESFNYTNKGSKNGGFTWHDVIYLQRRFIFGKIKLKLKFSFYRPHINFSYSNFVFNIYCNDLNS